MMRSPILVAVLLGVSAVPCRAQAPSTDIYLAPLHPEDGGRLRVGLPVNITHRDGYDNQPSFTPDNRAILYTAVSDGQSDIWRYDLADGITRRVTNTPESEYSPTVMPDGTRFSVIRVERDSTQRLWSFALDGSDPQLVLRDLKPIGYHAWLDSTHLAVFVLGKPATLHYVDRDGTGDSIAARSIGRSLHLVPGKREISYTVGTGDGPPTSIMALGLPAGSIARKLGAVAEDNEFHAWTPDGQLLTASKGKLLRWNGREGKAAQWNPVADLSSAGVKNVSRLAVSPDGKWMAFVAEPAPTKQ